MKRALSSTMETLSSLARPLGRYERLIDIASVFISRIGGVLVALFFLPLYANVLSPRDFGAVAIILSLQTFFLVADLGLATVLARETAMARDEPAALTAVMQDRRRGELVLAGTLALIAAISVLGQFAGILTFSEVLTVIAASALLALLVLLNVAQLSLNALDRFRLSAALTVSGTLVRASLTGIALTRIEASLHVFVFTQLIVAICHYAITRRVLDRANAGKVEWASILREPSAFVRLAKRCAPVLVYTLGGAAAINLDKPTLAVFLSAEASGWYFLATTFAMVPIGLLAGPLNQYFAPRITHAEGRADVAARRRHATAFHVLLLPAVIVPSAVLISQAPLLTEFWLQDGANIRVISSLGALLALGTALGALGYYPSTFLIAVGDNHFLAILSASSSVLVLLATAWFAARGSLYGVAQAYVVFHTATCLMLWMRVRRFWDNTDFARLLLAGVFKPFAVLIIACLTGWIFAGAIAGDDSSLVEIAIHVGSQIIAGGLAVAIIWRRCYRAGVDS